MVRTLRVMTFNIHAGVGTDGRYDLGRIARIVNIQRPDLVGLQEVDRRFDPRSGFEDQPARLADLTGMLPCYGPAILGDARGTGATPGEYGNLILSRLPILSSRSTALPSALEPGGMLEAVVDLGGGARLTFFDIHLGLGFGSAERLPQAQAAAARVDAATSPRVFVGDLNAQPPSEELVPLFDRLPRRVDRGRQWRRIHDPVRRARLAHRSRARGPRQSSAPRLDRPDGCVRSPARRV